ncbi:hypothetical protein Forpi1262_v016719 [Fusarium oxysporum f. sp. raphani]|uniref:Uncharacterized protein n=1 Tax=Fusarium oxysporum f. sp. raphani TaxID=96318 RepID=A0A8J5P458_FUSOX|nr:hypothetical protein Forpi1262_v016719 [Fusarium oxysporum f. sp. raphani]
MQQDSTVAIPLSCHSTHTAGTEDQTVDWLDNSSSYDMDPQETQSGRRAVQLHSKFLTSCDACRARKSDMTRMLCASIAT